MRSDSQSNYPTLRFCSNCFCEPPDSRASPHSIRLDAPLPLPNSAPSPIHPPSSIHPPCLLKRCAFLDSRGLIFPSSFPRDPFPPARSPASRDARGTSRWRARRTAEQELRALLLTTLPHSAPSESECTGQREKAAIEKEKQVFFWIVSLCMVTLKRPYRKTRVLTSKERDRRQRIKAAAASRP